MCALWLYEEKEDRRVWAVLFITAVSALGFSGSAIILPAAVLAGMVPVMRMKRKLSGLPYCILCMVPSVLYAGVYFACKLGLLSLAAGLFRGGRRTILSIVGARCYSQSHHKSHCYNR